MRFSQQPFDPASGPCGDSWTRGAAHALPGVRSWPRSGHEPGAREPHIYLTIVVYMFLFSFKA